MKGVNGVAVDGPHVKDKPIATLECLRRESYIRSCRVLPDKRSLLVGGEANTLCLWDLTGPMPKVKVSFLISL